MLPDAVDGVISHYREAHFKYQWVTEGFENLCKPCTSKFSALMNQYPALLSLLTLLVHFSKSMSN